MSSKKKVLIIDDDNDFCTATKLILENAGYEVFVAEDGKSGVEFATKLHPDLAIVDMMMETWSEGFNVVSRLRGSDATKNIKLIMLSAVDLHGPYDEPNQPTDDAPKVERVLTKPIMATDLITQVNALVG
jgi:two-component system, OmpR family, alkaline phosphatase synthesis response regulator PhoP